MWVQLFGPAVIWFHTAASNYASKNPDVTITVLPVPYTSLQSKILPSIAAGTEADIMFAYNDWFFSNDVTELFLNLSKYMEAPKHWTLSRTRRHFPPSHCQPAKPTTSPTWQAYVAPV